MEWTTHALSGIALGFVVTNDWKGAAIAGIASVIPDLDEPRSKFGKVFFFISIPVSMIFKHRTFTHSILFTLLSVSLLSMFLTFSQALAAGIGIASHIIGDMMTGRVHLLYPFNGSFGMDVNRLNYMLLDRIVRISLVLFIGVIAYQSIWN